MRKFKKTENNDALRNERRGDKHFGMEEETLEMGENLENMKEVIFFLKEANK